MKCNKKYIIISIIDVMTIGDWCLKYQWSHWFMMSCHISIQNQNSHFEFICFHFTRSYQNSNWDANNSKITCSTKYNNCSLNVYRYPCHSVSETQLIIQPHGKSMTCSFWVKDNLVKILNRSLWSLTVDHSHHFSQTGNILKLFCMPNSIMLIMHSTLDKSSHTYFRHNGISNLGHLCHTALL